MKPDVSIIVPLYNQGEFLGECIDSVLEQTHENWECIIVNDASTDNSGDIAEEIAKQDKRIKLIHHKTNQKLPITRNTGIYNAVSDCILPLDADDMIEPIMLERTLDCINKKLGSIIHVNFHEIGEGNSWVTMPDYDYDKLQIHNQISGCALYYKKIWEDVGGYDNIGLEDWNFWLKAGYLGYYGYHLSEFLFIYRVRSDSSTNKWLKDPQPTIDIMLDSFEKFKRRIDAART